MIRTLAALGAVMLAASPASAAIFVYAAPLAGASEVPPAATPGTGIGQIVIDDVANVMRVQISFSGLIGNTTASHIHCCQPVGTNAQVATTTPNFPGFPLGVTSGTYDRTFDMTLASSFNPAFVTAHGGSVAQARSDLFAGIAAGQAYLNVHSSMFPGGEIRGQLAAVVPEPEVWIAMILGFGLAGLGLRRQSIRTTASLSR